MILGLWRRYCAAVSSHQIMETTCDRLSEY